VNDTLATATPLHDITQAGLVQIPGAIGDDPYYSPFNWDAASSNPANQVDMYSFTISGDGRYTLTAEAFAGRIGSLLDPALSLFRLTGQNPDGTLACQAIAENDNSFNGTLASDGEVPLYTDPVLFAGLTAGKYVIAVSSTGNSADLLLGQQFGTDGIFDPNQSHSGSTGQTTGRYVLNLFVQPADPTPPSVVGANVTPGIVFTGPPTQFNVLFSAPMNLIALAVASGQQWQLATFSGSVDPTLLARFPVYVADQNGTRFNVALSSYDMTTGMAKFTLLEPLTDGSYSLHLSGPGGLTDLAGDPLAGNSPGGDYVVPFTVTNSPARPAVFTLTNPDDSFNAPTDLGVLFPSEIGNGVVVQRDFRAANPAPDDRADFFRFTLLEEASVIVTLGGPGMNVSGRAVLLNDDGNPVYPAVDPLDPKSHSVMLVLQPGTYTLEVGGWSPSFAGDAVYQLSITEAGLQENPTPLTSGPAPAYRLRLDSAAGSSPLATPAQPVTPSAVGTTPQLNLPGSGTPAITLTVDRGVAGSAPPSNETLPSAATALAAGPVGVVGTVTSAPASELVRLVLPTADVLSTATAVAPVEIAGTGAAHIGVALGTVESVMRALTFFTIDWLRMPPLMPRMLLQPADLPPAPEMSDADDGDAAQPADRRNGASGCGRLDSTAWAAALALVGAAALDLRPGTDRRRRQTDPRWICDDRNTI
jgi:hypothetical protein